MNITDLFRKKEKVLDFTPQIEAEIKRYTDLGVNRDKIVAVHGLACAVWSLSKKKITNAEPELIKDGNNYRVSYENNRIVSFQNHEGLNVDEINNSNGIIITDLRYDFPYFRYEFIPTV